MQSPLNDQGLRRLAQRVLFDAVKAAERGDREDQAWLSSARMALWCCIVGLDPVIAQHRAQVWLTLEMECRRQRLESLDRP
jgi:hypothetical protein